MSHEVESMAYAHKKGSNEEAYSTPWHGLGKPVHHDLGPHQLMKEAGLDWKVQKVETLVQIPGQNELIKTGRHVLYRDSDNKILTHVTEDWEPCQNEEAFDFFKKFCEAGHVEMNTAGSLYGGRRVWALGKMKGKFKLFNGKDETDQYLLFTNPHEWGKSVDIRVTAIRVVCANTLSLAFEKGNKGDFVVKASHRRKFDVEKAQEKLVKFNEVFGDYQGKAEFLASKRFSVDDMKEYYKTLFPSKSAFEEGDERRQKKNENGFGRTAQIVFDALDKQPGAELGAGTWWAPFNSVTFAIDHLLGRSQDSRLMAAWYGGQGPKKMEALKLALEYAEKSKDDKIAPAKKKEAAPKAAVPAKKSSGGKTKTKKKETVAA